MSSVIDNIIKSVGKSTGKQIKVLEDIEYNKNLQVIPSGIVEIDKNLLEINGWCRGRISEISGGEASGKSTIMYKTAACCQKMPGNLGDEGVVVIYDVEHVLQDEFGRNWLELQGVDRSKLICMTDIIAEDILYSAYEFCKKGVDLIIIDSVAAMVAKADSLEHVKSGKNAVDQLSPGFGHLAGALSLGLRQLNKVASENNTAIVFVNQLRDKLGGFGGWGATDNTPGGRALKFAASLRMRLDKVGELKDGDNKVGVLVKGYIAKSKISTPLRKSGTDTPGFINIRFDGQPVDDFDSILETAIILKLVTKEKNTYTFAGIKAVGKDKFKAAIKENEEAKNAIVTMMQANKDVAFSDDDLPEIGDGD